jgi:hypothetical protein
VEDIESRACEFSAIMTRKAGAMFEGDGRAVEGTIVSDLEHAARPLSCLFVAFLYERSVVKFRHIGWTHSISTVFAAMLAV